MSTKAKSPCVPNLLMSVIPVRLRRPYRRKSTAVSSFPSGSSMCASAIAPMSIDSGVASTSNTNSAYGHPTLERVAAGFQLITPVVEGIPVAGTPLKAIIGGLLGVLNVVDRISQNKSDLETMTSRLRDLLSEIDSLPPASTPGMLRAQAKLIQQLVRTFTQLEDMKKMGKSRYETVSRVLQDSMRDVQFFLTKYQACHTLMLMEMCAIHPTARLSVTADLKLVDATGRQFSISLNYAGSLEQFQAAVRLLFVNKKTAEDRTLIEFMDQGMYDLCLDTGAEVIQINDEVAFEKVREPDTKIVMRVVLIQEANHAGDHKRYTCPRCKEKTTVERGSTASSIDCIKCGVRFQATDVSRRETTRTDKKEESQLWVIRNIHIKYLESKAPWGSSADYTGYPNDAYTPWAPMPGGYSPWTGSLLPSIPQEIPVGHVHGSRGPSMGYTPWVPPRSVDSTGYLVGTPWAPPRSLDYTGYPMGTRSGSPPPEVPPSFYASRDLSADGTGIISP